MQFKSIGSKLTFWAGTCLVLSVGSIVSYSFAKQRSAAMSAAEEGVSARVDSTASRIGAEFSSVMETARALAQILSAVKDEEVGIDLSRDNVNGILRTMLQQDERFVGVFTCWEPDAFDDLDIAYGGVEGHDETGRLVPYYHRAPTGEFELVPLRNYAETGMDANGQPRNAFYEVAKADQQEYASSPFISELGGGQSVARFVVPLLANGEFYGVVGIDCAVDFIHELLASSATAESSENLVVFDSRGIVVGSSDGSKQVGKPLADRAKFRSGDGAPSMFEELLVCSASIALSPDIQPWRVGFSVASEAVTAEATSAAWRMLWIGASTILAALFFIFWVARSLALPVRDTAGLLMEISEGDGDLTQRLPERGRDELGALAKGFNRFVSKINVTIAKVISTVDEVNGAANQISSASQSLSTTSEQQASLLDSITHSLSDIETSTTHNWKNVERVSDISREASDNASKGVEQMGQLNTTMSDLADASARTSNIVSMIEGIAFQTNLLALNAAVEAARAGEAGRGFAVVAEEVRGLAKRSADAAKDTAALIDESNKLVEACTAIAGDVNSSLTEISGNAEEVDTLVAEVKNATQAQGENMMSVTKSVGMLESATTSTAASSEELAAIARVAEHQVNGLRGLVEHFRVDEQAAWEDSSPTTAVTSELGSTSAALPSAAGSAQPQRA